MVRTLISCINNENSNFSSGHCLKLIILYFNGLNKTLENFSLFLYLNIYKNELKNLLINFL
jgi:hypothetical protein